MTTATTDKTRHLWESLGFSEISTGGGCTAYSLQQGDEYILVTDGDANIPTDDSTSAYIGFYDSDDQPVVYFDCRDVIEAVSIFKRSSWYQRA